MRIPLAAILILIGVANAAYSYEPTIIFFVSGRNAWAIVKLSESLGTNTSTEELLTSIQRLQDRKQYVKTQVIITGDLEDLGNPCFAPRFVITGKKLEQLTPVSLVPF